MALAVVRDRRLVHGGEIGRIARRHLRRQLVIARPIHDVDLDVNVRIVRIELVDQGRDDPAFAFRRVDIDGKLRIFRFLRRKHLDK